MNDERLILDYGAVGVALATFFELLPALASVLSIVWLILRIIHEVEEIRELREHVKQTYSIEGTDGEERSRKKGYLRRFFR